jgi:AmmeMemoRadiSam system protein B
MNNNKLLFTVFVLTIVLVSVGLLFRANKLSLEDSDVNILKNLSIASGVVPHHGVAQEIIEKFFKYISSKEKPENIIILSPDHFNATNLIEKSFISIDIDTKEFHDLAINNSLLKNLKNNNLAFGTYAIDFDHGVTELLPYIKKHFPDSSILPIIISSKATKEDVEELIKSINSQIGSNAIIIASVDFSHYLPSSAADLHDVKSIATLIDFKKSNFENIEADSWQSLYGARYFAKLRNSKFPNVIGRGKSSDFMKYDDYIDKDGITSYFSVVFEKEDNQKIIEKGKTILLVGNMMFEQEVELLIKKNSSIYPFQKISQLLRGVDIVFGNMDGPIVKKPKSSFDDSLKFNFLPQVADGLNWANFNLLSLANNHVMDEGENGFKETKQFLEEGSIFFVGDPLKCTKDFYFKKDNMIFLAFNKVEISRCSDEEIINTINLVRSLSPESFLVTSIYWGEEYETTGSDFQKKLAHKIIEAGADTAIGYHPHVVQDIEIYKNKLIFYSLGDFIFDQPLSKEIQDGLVVGIEIYDNKILYRLFPIENYQSQPSLMTQKETNQFLEKLASKSSLELSDKIKNGIIEIEQIIN